jgi:glyoxylase-like metal-dependent hydrolase (beta-lactamase superfamily II)
MKIADGLHRVGRSSLVNSYLVEQAGKITIIDAGIAGLWQELPAELAAMNRTAADIAGIVLTHGDVDHVGYAERLRLEAGIGVWVHEADAALARGEVGKRAKWGRLRIGPTLGFLWFAATHGGLRTTPIQEVRTFSDGVTLDLPGSPRVIAVPGHTSGSVAFHVPAVDALFVGDAMTTRNVLTGVVRPALGPFTVDPAQAIASLERLRNVGARWLLPGHGEPWTGGVQVAVDAIRGMPPGG